MPLPVYEQVNLDDKKKAECVWQFHEKVRANIEKQTMQYATQANKSRKCVVFEPSDWVWLHLRNECFPI